MPLRSPDTTRRRCASRPTAVGVVLAMLLVTGCASRPVPPEGAIVLERDVAIVPLTPGVWRHLSWKSVPGFGLVSSNGLVVALEDGSALVVDTAWTPEDTAVLLDWTERAVGPVAAVAITHAHDDRIGGIAEVHRRGIESVALRATAARAAETGWPPIRRPVDSGHRLDALGVRGELFHPGAGHTLDNAVVYLDESAVLAGGCLVRSLEARTMGNTADGDVGAWSGSIVALERRYPRLEIVVPGHGEPGDAALLEHTRALLEGLPERAP